MSETISALPVAASAGQGDLIPATQGSGGPGTGTTRAITPSLIMLLGPPRSTVAALPVVTTANEGGLAFATNARNTGEGGGAGTGCLVTVNKNGIWVSVWSGVAPTT